MTTVRVSTVEQVIRVTPIPDGPSVNLISTPQSVVKVSQVGVQGPPGPQGLPGEDGADGTAEIPEVLDGGNF